MRPAGRILSQHLGAVIRLLDQALALTSPIAPVVGLPAATARAAVATPARQPLARRGKHQQRNRL